MTENAKNFAKEIANKKNGNLCLYYYNDLLIGKFIRKNKHY